MGGSPAWLLGEKQKGLTVQQCYEILHIRHVWETGKWRTGFGWGHLRERDNFKDLGLDERIILKWIFNNCEWEAWTGFLWLRIGTGVGLL
jgi:hypothetical protein